MGVPPSEVMAERRSAMWFTSSAASAWATAMVLASSASFGGRALDGSSGAVLRGGQAGAGGDVEIEVGFEIFEVEREVEDVGDGEWRWTARAPAWCRQLRRLRRR